VILTYAPCLIPPKNLKDPVRVGQAKDNQSKMVRLLERLRKIPGKQYRKHKTLILNKAVEAIEQKAKKFTYEELEKVKQRIEKIFEKIRKMDETEFQLNKQDLAKQLSFLKKQEKVESQLLKAQRENRIIRSKIRHNFLNPAIKNVLQERLKIMKEFEMKKPVDLDRISPADNCKDGKCAID
jgi:hypothetical protein